MFVSVLVTLTVLTLYNMKDVNRFLTCLFVLLVTALTYELYYLDPYAALEGWIGFYGFQSLPPVLSIIVLIFVRCRLSTCLMALYASCVSLNVGFFWLEGIGLDVDNAYLICGFFTYAIQCSLMYSEKLTNSVYEGAVELYGSIRRHALAGSYKAHDSNHHAVRNSANHRRGDNS